LCINAIKASNFLGFFLNFLFHSEPQNSASSASEAFRLRLRTDLSIGAPIRKLGMLLCLLMVLTACSAMNALKTPQSLTSADTDDTEYSFTDSLGVYAITPLDQEHADQARAAQRDYTRALQSLSDGDSQTATVYLQSITARFPKLAGPWVNLALIHMRNNDFGTAASHLRKAVSIYPNHAPAHNLLGVCLKELGKFDDARGSYRKALALDPQYADAHYNFAILLELYFRDFKKALEHFEKFQALSPSPDKQVANWISDLKRRAKE